MFSIFTQAFIASSQRVIVANKLAESVQSGTFFLPLNICTSLKGTELSIPI